MDAILYGMMIHRQIINHVFMITLWFKVPEAVGQVMDKDIMDGVYVGCMTDRWDVDKEYMEKNHVLLCKYAIMLQTHTKIKVMLTLNKGSENILTICTLDSVSFLYKLIVKIIFTKLSDTETHAQNHCWKNVCSQSWVWKHHQRIKMCLQTVCHLYINFVHQYVVYGNVTTS